MTDVRTVGELIDVLSTFDRGIKVLVDPGSEGYPTVGYPIKIGSVCRSIDGGWRTQYVVDKGGDTLFLDTDV